MTRTAILSAAAAAMIGILMSAAPVSAKTYVTAKEVARHQGGYKLDLGNGKVAQIKRIRAPRSKTTECRVHLPSVRKQALRAVARGGSNITIPISVKFHDYDVYDPNSPYLPGTCGGKGSGCTILVWLP